MAPNFDIGLIDDAIKNAPTDGYAQVNYGKVTMEVHAARWVEDKEEGKRVIKLRPITKKAPLNSKAGEYAQITFQIGIQEFNEALDWEFKRRVDVKVGTPRKETDWTSVVEPSLVATFGKNYLAELAKEPYVLVESVASVTGKTTKEGKALTTIKFLKAFKDKAACEADRAERFQKQDDSSDSDDDDATAGEGEISAEMKGEVKAFIKAMKGETKDDILEALEEAYPGYDPDELYALK